MAKSRFAKLEVSKDEVAQPPPRYRKSIDGASADCTSETFLTTRSASRGDETVKSNGAWKLLRLIYIPIFNAIVSCALIGVTIYTYQTANGKSSDYTMINMRVPTVVSLLMTVVKIFLASGITLAVSEYKWVRLQKPEGSKFAMLDIYDACTRGVGDVARVITGVRFDMVLIAAIILQIGLIAIGPASQEILGYTNVEVCDLETGIYYSNLTQADLTNLRSSGDISMLKGVKQDFLVRTAFAQAALGFMPQPLYECKTGSLNCTYNGVGILHTAVDCQPGSLQTQIVNINTNNTTSLSEYYGYNKQDALFPPIVDVPSAFYAGSMHGRTFFDLNNRTKDFMSTSKYNPALRQLFGDQTLVLVLSDEGNFDTFLERNATPKVLECTLRSKYNISSLVHRTDHIEFYKQETQPLNIDYGHLANNSYWSTQGFSDNSYLPLNAYAMQLTIMRYFAADPGSFQGIIRDWSIYSQDLNSTNAVPTFFRDMLRNADLAMTFSLPDNPVFMQRGTHCYVQGNVYTLDPAAYCGLALSLLVPLLWWATVWILSVYQTNGVSRGNSQIALMVTGLTQSIRQQFQGMSPADKHELFEKAKKVDVTFGESRGHIAFGAPDEVNPIGTRRSSF